MHEAGGTGVTNNKWCDYQVDLIHESAGQELSVDDTVNLQ
jgi:hypothetical protein